MGTSTVPDVIIVGGARSPFTKASNPKKKGALADWSSVELLAHTVASAAERLDLALEEVADLIAGCANGSRGQAGNIARLTAIKLGQTHLPGITMDRLCASGFEAVLYAGERIRSGWHGHDEIFISGGVDMMSNVPLMTMADEMPASVVNMLGPVALNMGRTADELARKYGITRTECDEFAVEEHRRTAAAWDNNFFMGEVAPLALPYSPAVLMDDGFRRDASLEGMAKLKPVFTVGGATTAGNASLVTDGAAAVIVCSHETAQRRGWKPLARIVNHGVAACEPDLMGDGVTPAIEQALKFSGLFINDISLFEINTAFAAVPLAAMRRLEIPRDKMNVHGGGCAIGHPLGATGARLVLTLARAMRARGVRYGCAAACVGFGQGRAVILENLAY